MTRDEAISIFRNKVDKQLKWNDFAQDFELLLHEIFDDMEHRTCDGCMYHYSDDGHYPIEPCAECSRFFGDCYMRKRDYEQI
jgi:hypothetical protein